MIIESFSHASNLIIYKGRLVGLGANPNGDHWAPTENPRELLRRIRILAPYHHMCDVQGEALLTFADALEAEIAAAEKGGA